MFCKNLRYYRLKKNLTKKALAEMINVSAMAITNYEEGKRRPSMEILRALAEALGVNITDFLAVRNENLVFEHAEFRKTASLSQMEQEYIKESVENYFGRFMTVVEILGGDVRPNPPECHKVLLTEDNEENASRLRSHLGFASDGPIEALIGKLENKGILACECTINNSKFSGMNGYVNGRPFIVTNPDMPPERIRTTAVHELTHLMFKWPDEIDKKEKEEIATSVAGAFLFPRSDAIRELGIKRTVASPDMTMVAKEYGISMMLLVSRARSCGVLSENATKRYYIDAAGFGWKDKEPSRIATERPSLFEQLVYRAVNEEEISVSKGAELLQCPFEDIMAIREFSGVKSAVYKQ